MAKLPLPISSSLRKLPTAISSWTESLLRLEEEEDEVGCLAAMVAASVLPFTTGDFYGLELASPELLPVTTADEDKALASVSYTWRAETVRRKVM